MVYKIKRKFKNTVIKELYKRNGEKKNSCKADVVHNAVLLAGCPAWLITIHLHISYFGIFASGGKCVYLNYETLSHNLILFKYLSMFILKGDVDIFCDFI